MDTVAVVAFLPRVRVCLLVGASAVEVSDVTDVPLAALAAAVTSASTLVVLLLLLPATAFDSFFGRPRFFFDGVVVWSSDAATDPDNNTIREEARPAEEAVKRRSG